MRSGLTVFGPCEMGKHTEGLGLQVGCTAGPLRHLHRVPVLWLNIGLVHWGSTVYLGVFNRECAKERERNRKREKEREREV